MQTMTMKRRKSNPYLVWSDGTKLTLEQVQELTGLSIGQSAITKRLVRAKQDGLSVDTLAKQIAVLSTNTRPAPAASSEAESGDIPLDADKAEAGRLKTIREAMLLDEKRKQAEIETRLKRKEVFRLDSIAPAWSALVVSIRESLRGAIPMIVDKVLPLDDRDTALDRAEDELSRHLERISEFDLERELNEQTGDETWQFTEND